MSNTHGNLLRLKLHGIKDVNFIFIYIENYSKKDKQWLKKNKIYFEEENKVIEIMIANEVKNNSIIFDILKHFVLRTAV